ncbi:DUF6491 family protein [Kordiimonas lipolytica]|uniref:DUF6491 family protein n=1 Tax=Kordiimonas lipolytica TaxID=1662421 RepID=A0ABV8U5Z2_9PROT|nr:DUF6491 family protein [Kordiimonas lipolytica]
MPDVSRLSLFFPIAGVLALVSFTVAQAQETTDAKPIDDKQCINADKISGYRVVSDELVRLEMQGQKDILLRLKRHCPQLYYHKYMSFTPVNGKLCARFDDIITRSGTPCRIESFSDVSKETTERAK